MALEIRSAAFQPGGEIPARHTCEGEDLSPPLAWSGVPAGAKGLALVVDDPDAPDPKAPPPLEELMQYPAVSLFQQRARAVKPDFEVTAGSQTVHNVPTKKQ